MWMGAGEQEPQLVVVEGAREDGGIAGCRGRVTRWRGFFLEEVSESFPFFDLIQGFVLADREDPAGGVGWESVFAPGGEGCREGVLNEVFRAVEVDVAGEV